MEQNSAEILRNAAYEEGYKAGVECGKLCAAQQILDDLEEVFTKKREEYIQKREENKDEDYPERYSYWLARSLTCGEHLHLLSLLRNKYLGGFK